MHVKQNILIKNRKVTKYLLIISQNMKQKKKNELKLIPNANLKGSKSFVKILSKIHESYIYMLKKRQIYNYLLENMPL